MEVESLTEYIEAIRGIDSLKAIENQLHECDVIHNDYNARKDPNADPDLKAYIERNLRYLQVLKELLQKEEHFLERQKNSKSSEIFNTTIGPTFFYRGQCNDYPPLPSVFRDKFLTNEDYLYHELILCCPESFRGLSHLDTLVLMQHYGLPTRLLDVTTNPLVALYFACKDYSGGNPANYYVYIYRGTKDITAYADSDRVLLLSCLPVFSLLDKMKILDQVDKGLMGSGNMPLLSGNRSYPAIVERFFHEVAKEVPAFKREIKALDLIRPIFVKPGKANARILKQDGAFIISGLCYDSFEAQTKIQALCAGKIQIHNREKILSELDDIGINEASLFPEVDKVAGYLKEKCV